MVNSGVTFSTETQTVLSAYPSTVKRGWGRWVTEVYNALSFQIYDNFCGTFLAGLQEAASERDSHE